MARNWYPVIDYAACVECGTCVDFCSHGVYDKERSPSPRVVNPEGCVDHCHGCGEKCPEGAITYVGDDTGWTPPHRVPAQQGESPCCRDDNDGGGILIEYLYLDLETCNRCIGTDAVLDEVVEALVPALALAGCSIDYRKVEMASAEVAERYRFLSSPTIRVNGHDICRGVVESGCDCCGEISGTDVDCRIFEYEGRSYEVPPKEMLARAIIKAAFAEEGGRPCSCDYTLPENLRRFFEGKEAKVSSCSCGSGCC